MNKDYYIEVKFTKNRWTLTHTEKSHKEALEYIKNHAPTKYAMRIVRITRTVVFESK